METPLTPLAFAARARRIYARRDATVFEGVTRSYGEFLDRVDRWSKRLQELGVKPGDRVAYIAQNVPSNLEGYYAAPQIGAVLVPMNYRLAASDFIYILNHCGATVLCVDKDYVEALEAIRAELPLIRHFVALEGARDGWLDYEAEIAGASGDFDPVEIDENDLITINYTSGTTARPKGVMITHRNAYLNVMGTLVHFRVDPADRYLWTLPMFHANGWTFTWLATARGAAHVCLRKVDPAAVFRLVGEAGVTTLCAAPTVLQDILPNEMRGFGASMLGLSSAIIAGAGGPWIIALAGKAAGDLGHAFLLIGLPFLLAASGCFALAWRARLHPTFERN